VLGLRQWRIIHTVRGSPSLLTFFDVSMVYQCDDNRTLDRAELVNLIDSIGLGLGELSSVF
jgi:hypothetical protein